MYNLFGLFVLPLVLCRHGLAGVQNRNYLPSRLQIYSAVSFVTQTLAPLAAGARAACAAAC